MTRWLNQYISALTEIRDRIAIHDSSLDRAFAKAQQLRQQWQATNDTEEEIQKNSPKTS